MKNSTRSIWGGAATIAFAFALVVLPAPTVSAQQVYSTGQGNQVGNCIPFGSGRYGPYMAFFYRDIPAFTVQAGDVLAFDTWSANDADITVDLALSVVPNGQNGPTNFTTVLSNGTPKAPRGDSVIGNFELEYTVSAGFSFPGGGLAIRVKPVGGYASDNSCTGNLVGSQNSSGVYVSRAYYDNDGNSPWDGSSGGYVPAFRIERGVQQNQPPVVSSPGAQESVEGASVSLQIQGSDPDNDSLNWNATGLPAGLSINGTGRIVGTVQQGSNNNSPYTVSVSVSDGQETRGVQFSWTVYDDVPPQVVFNSPSVAWHGSAQTVAGTIADPGCGQLPVIATEGVHGYTTGGNNGAYTFSKGGVGAGRYTASLTATSRCTGLQATAERVFGVDTSDPTANVVAARLNQNGVDPNNAATWPVLGAYDELGLIYIAADSVSGVRTVRTVVRNTANQQDVEIFTHSVNLSGSPPGGATNLTLPNGCSSDTYCADGKLTINALPGTNLLLILTVTDAVGHTAVIQRYFRKLGLREALVGWRDAIPQSSDVQAAQTRLDAARASLNHAIAGFDAEYYGNIALTTQTAQSALLGAAALDNGLDFGASDAAATFVGDVFVGFLASRLAGHRNEGGDEDTLDTAEGFVDDARDADDIGTQLNLLANAFFWMEDGADPMDSETFELSQSLLGRIITELDDYVTYDPALVAQSQLGEARTNLSEVKVLIDQVVAEGDRSLTDLEHAELLIGLTDTAENLKESQGLGAWVRNWQWGLTLITYLYARRALFNAEDYLGSFNPVFIEGVTELNRADGYRGERKADDFLNLLINSRCLTIGIYNRAYDPDIEPPQVCCDEMIRFQRLDGPFPVPRSCVNDGPVLTDPDDQDSVVGDDVSLELEAVDDENDDLTWSATGLPPGLSIHTSTGVISGTISGNDGSPYSVTVTVRDEFESDSVTFQWTVSPRQQQERVCEPFNDPMINWRSGWLKQNSNLENYYVYHGAQHGSRGNNPTGIWVHDGNPSAGAVITFAREFGINLTRIELRAACYATSTFVVKDIDGAQVFSQTCSGGNVHSYSNVFNVTSQNGIGSFAFVGTRVEGSTALDDICVE